MPKSAAEATPPAGNRFVEFDEFIDYQLTKASRSIQSTDVLVGVVGLALGLTVYLFVFILADHWLISGGLGTVARGLYWLVGAVAMGYWVATRLLKPLNSRVNVLFAAKAIEKTQPGLKSSLLTLTDLKQAGRATSGAIKGSLEKRAAVGLSKADVEEAVDRSALMKCSYVLLFLLAVFCGYALVSPKSILQSAWRALVPFSATGVATKTRIDNVSPGDTEVPALSHLDVEVEVSGQAPKEATLYYTTADRAFVDEAVPLRDSGEGLRRYRGTLIGTDGRGLRQNLTYYVTAGDATSKTYAVTVVQSPSAVVDSVAYEYQPYTGLANKEEPGGAIDAWEGTRVTVHATANQRVKSATVLFSDTEDTSVKAEEQSMLISDGTKLKASWVLAFRPDREASFPKFYRVQLKTEDGHEDPQPTLQPLNIRHDLPPKAEIVFPKSDLQAPVNATIPIAYRASDPDFKLRSLVLNLEHDGKILPVSPRLFDGPPDEESREGTFKLKLKDLNLAAGSRLTYWLEARDNFMPFGERSGNKTLTPRLNIDLVEPQPPAQAQQQEKAADAQAQEALKESRPDQGQPGEKGGEPKPGEQAKGSESAPGQEPMPGENQEGKGEDGKPGTTGDSKAGDSQPDRGQPGDNKQPMPGERSDDSKQQPNETPDQRTPGDRNSEQQPGDKGPPQGDGQQGQPGQSDPGQDQQGKQGPNGSKEGRNGESGSSQNQQPPAGNRPGERAPDDQALKELLKWHEKKQQEEQQRQPNKGASKPEPGSDGQPGEKEDQPKPGENKSGDNATDPMKDPGASGKSPDNPGATGEKGSDPSTNQNSQNDAGQPGKSGEKPPQDSSKGGEKAGDQKQTGEKPGDQQSGSGEKNSQPGQADKSGEGQKGEASSEQSKSAPAGTEKTGPEKSAPDQKGTGDQGPGEKGADPAAKPGDESAKSPMKGEGAPGEKASSQDNPNPKTGATDSNSKGQESPTGESGERKQPGDQNSKSGDKAANSDQKPVGQKDNEGTREAGEGDPGSSTPSQAGGQKAAGQGEAGKNGEKSSSGEKSGTGQSPDGKQGSQPGSKSGDGQGGAKKPQDGGSGGKESGQPGGDSKGEPSSGDKAGESKPSGDKAGDSKPSGDKSGGDQKSGGDSAPKPSGDAGDKQEAGGKGGDQNQSGDQKQPGEQPGGDQKDGEQKGGGESKGGEQKGGGGQGDGKSGKPSGGQSSQQPGKSG
ncbi:MAG TPA: hypothetical protein VM452_12535, partial [Caulifigura sp.]|nr:hypothetical protein [Caulifigura sp.]